jgi:8-oxo-dGTP pyrophosphatase MutT (NUDIX family)
MASGQISFGNRCSQVVDMVAATVVLRHDGAALLQHRDDKPGLRAAGMWGLPGGHAEVGESMLECARRELREETEYEASSLELLSSFDGTDESGTPFRVTYFWCRYDGIQPVVCHEGQALAFVERSTVAHYPIPAYVIDVWDAASVAAGASMEALQKSP